MTQNHLLSASLFSELFQHNLVSADGRIIANDQQLRDYSTFLIKQSKDRTAKLHVERKNLVNDAESLLRLEDRSEEENKLLEEIINELDLEFDKDGLLSLKKEKKPQEQYLGPKEPKKSIFEKKIEAELKRVKTLKSDLRQLDEWLEQMSQLKPITEAEASSGHYKEAGIKYRQRTSNRMCDMENARTKLIKHHYKDYDKTLRSVLDRKLPKEKYLTRLSSPKAKDKEEDIPKNKKKDRDTENKVHKSVAVKSTTKVKRKNKKEDAKSNGEVSAKVEAEEKREKIIDDNEQKDDDVVKDGDDVESEAAKIEEILENGHAKEYSKVDHESSNGHEIVQESAVKTNNNTEKDDEVFEHPGANTLAGVNGKEVSTTQKTSTSSNDVATTAQPDDETSTVNMRNSIEKDTEIKEIDNTREKDTPIESADDIKELLNKITEANTNGKAIDTRVNNTPIVDNYSTETTSGKNSKTDAYTKRRDTFRTYETGTYGSVIDDDIVTQVQVDIQRERDEEIKNKEIKNKELNNQ